MAKAAILGHGVVGSGVAELLLKNAALISERTGEGVELGAILDIRDFPDLPYSDKFTKDFESIVSDPSVDIVIEVIGGLHPAFEFVSRSLMAGKHVVTSNKELVAEKGAELLAIAKEKGVKFLFEASVGGGIPIIRPLHRCLAANGIESIVGILNGTTNYILTKMFKEGAAFDETLRKAQQLGYAEADPTADVEGIDACRKICILASLAFGEQVYPAAVSATGISGITPEQVRLAAEGGCVIKLLGVARKTEQGLVILVSPFAVPNDHPLSGVEDVFNGILVTGNAVGDVAFIGRGAGKFPTASAVVGDVMACVNGRGERNTIIWKDNGGVKPVPLSEVAFPRLVRVGGECLRTEPMTDSQFVAAYPQAKEWLLVI